MHAVAPATGRLSHLFRLRAGLALCALIAALALAGDALPWLAAHGLSALTTAIVLGMVVGNMLPAGPRAATAPGIGFSKQHLLRAGIVLYGVRLTLHDIGQVGAAGIVLDALMLCSTFALALVLGTRLFGLERDTALLIGAGSAICGAAAVLASAPVARARAEQVTVAVATVVVFGTCAIFLYPLLYRIDPHWHGSAGAGAFGIYAGSTIHEVAQVLAAGKNIGEAVANTAVITKMVRVMMLAPFLLLLGVFVARRQADPSDPSDPGAFAGRPALPWFALGFIAMVALNSCWSAPPAWRAAVLQGDTALLAMAMAALGLSTDLGAIRRAGARPLWLGALLAVWLVVGGAVLNRAVFALLG